MPPVILIPVEATYTQPYRGMQNYCLGMRTAAGLGTAGGVGVGGAGEVLPPSRAAPDARATLVRGCMPHRLLAVDRGPTRTRGAGPQDPAPLYLA